MKKVVIIIMCAASLISCNNSQKTEAKQQEQKAAAAPVAKVAALSEEQFRQQVFDFVENPTQWVFKGSKPCVVDFYADWCRPCKAIAPHFDSLAKLYAGKVNFYKVNIDNARNLSNLFRIQSIPYVLFCWDEAFVYSNGAYPFDFYKSGVDSLLTRVK